MVNSISSLSVRASQRDQWNIITVEVVDPIGATERQEECCDCLCKTNNESINICVSNDSIAEYFRHENDKE